MVVASPFDEVVRLTRRLLAAPPALRLYTSRDLAGVEMASAVSGGMIVAVGIADGMELGIGVRSMLVTRAVAEGTRLCGPAFAGLSGLATILVRSASEGAPDYQLGLALGRGVEPPRAETEGSRATATAIRIARAQGLRTPILDAVDAIAHARVPVKEAIARLLETTAEAE
jgi:glycerol-3-phosphate dehydrogenase (NAD(P)+)